MIQNKLFDSIGNLSDSYIEEALNMPTRQARPEKCRWRPKLVGAAAMLCVSAGLLYVIHSALSDSPLSPDKSKSPMETTESDSKIFTPLRVVAYAAETTNGSADKGSELQADIPTPLSQYSALMSNVPAMPFSFSYDEKTDGETIRFVVSADGMGMMQKYEVGESWKLTKEAASLECQEDEKVYWMPTGNFQSKTPEERDEDGDKKTDGNDDTDASPDIESINAKDLGADSAITVQVYSGQKLLETRYIGISYEDMYYTATLKLNVTSDTEDFGDFTIESTGYETTDEETHENIRKKLIEKAKRQGESNGGSQVAVPAEVDDYDIKIESNEGTTDENTEQMDELIDLDPSKREYGFPTNDYFIEREYHKK